MAIDKKETARLFAVTGDPSMLKFMFSRGDLAGFPEREKRQLFMTAFDNAARNFERLGVPNGEGYINRMRAGRKRLADRQFGLGESLEAIFQQEAPVRRYNEIRTKAGYYVCILPPALPEK